MRSDFEADMVPGEEISDYLCRYKNNQQNFKLIGGQRKLIQAMASYCSKITKADSINVPERNSGNPSPVSSNSNNQALAPSGNQNYGSQNENVNQSESFRRFQFYAQ